MSTSATQRKKRASARGKPAPTEDDALSIVYRAPKELIPYVNNAKEHSDEQVRRLASAIAEFGFTNPILIEPNDVIVAGHGRHAAALMLDLDAVPTITLGYLSEPQRRAYRLADNRLAEIGTGWDAQMLSIELDALDLDGFEIDLTGFDESFLVEPGTEGLADPDEAPPVPEAPTTRPGDIWVLDRHRLMCGDALSVEAMESLIEGAVADMVFTDPPYGIGYSSNCRKASPKFPVIENDDVLLDIAPTIERHSNGWVFVWTTWKVFDLWAEQLAPLGRPSNVIIWSKGGGGIGDLKGTFSTDYEMALVFNRGAELCGKRIGSVWSIGKDQGTDYRHPTQKPVALAVEAIEQTTHSRALVLDLFGGSGSTLIACERLGRRSCTMEIDPGYCDVIVSRWQTFTGRRAVREADGCPFDEAVD